MVKTVVYSLWLPIAVVLVSYLRFGIAGGNGTFEFFLAEPMAMLMLFAIAWPCAIPLTVAIRLLHQRSPAMAYLGAAVLGPLSVIAVVVGGLLGIAGVAVYSVAVSLPAWIALGFTKIRRPRHA
jgi:hypothetical protein